jgi:hypothetical protein
MEDFGEKMTIKIIHTKIKEPNGQSYGELT